MFPDQQSASARQVMPKLKLAGKRPRLGGDGAPSPKRRAKGNKAKAQSKSKGQSLDVFRDALSKGELAKSWSLFTTPVTWVPFQQANWHVYLWETLETVWNETVKNSVNHGPGNWTTSKQYLGLARSSLLFSERADGDQLSSSEPCKTDKKVVA